MKKRHVFLKGSWHLQKCYGADASILIKFPPKFLLIMII